MKVANSSHRIFSWFRIICKFSSSSWSLLSLSLSSLSFVAIPGRCIINRKTLMASLLALILSGNIPLQNRDSFPMCAISNSFFSPWWQRVSSSTVCNVRNPKSIFPVQTCSRHPGLEQSSHQLIPHIYSSTEGFVGLRKMTSQGYCNQVILLAEFQSKCSNFRSLHALQI